MASVRTRKRGKTFSYIFEVGRDANGKRKVIEKGGFPSKDAAYTAGVEAFNDWKHGNIGITSEKISVADFLRQWLQRVAEKNVKQSTLAQYTYVVQRRIIPYIGNLSLQELSPLVIDNMYHAHLSSGLSYGTIRSVRIVLNGALNYAVYPANLIQSNPCAYVKIPKQARRNCVKRSIISVDDFRQLLEDFPFGTSRHIPLLLLFNTGMRIGEVLGLTWDNIDLKAQTIAVKQQVATNQKRLTTLKNDSSVRTIPISAELTNTLQRWHNQQQENEQKLGGQYIRTYKTATGDIKHQSKNLGSIEGAEVLDLVCTNAEGKVLTYFAMFYMLKKYGLNAHSFRHTHATMLIENGAPPKGVADRLGHTDTKITENLYTHITEKLKTETLNVFTRALDADK